MRQNLHLPLIYLYEEIQKVMFELFTSEDLRQPPLTDQEREELIEETVHKAKLGVQFMYSLSEVAAKLRISIDVMQGLIYSYKLDCTRIRSVLRVPWWSLVEYLADPADDVDEAVKEYLQSLPQKESA
mgnify:CR=1 FL=1